VSRIRILSEAVAARIAAGEVVERPASVVKELVENALDAGASRIDVTLEEGGKRLVLVRDDGSGMDRDDALLAFTQHATSKVGAELDLSTLATRGFRGEALPAVASCSRTTLVTADRDGEGTRVRVENGVLRDVSAIGAPRGTSVEVRDLFAALPARRKFLRSAATELSHVVRWLEQQALAMPDVHLVLAQGRVLLELPRVPDVSSRVTQVLGREFGEAALRVGGERGELRVQAWLVRSGSGPGRLAQVITLVNGRPVTDRILSHALRESARILFGVDESAAGVLLVDLPPCDVDVNVHPAKREVRFAHPGDVHDTVRDLLRGRAVALGAFAPAVDSPSPAARLASVPAPGRGRQLGLEDGEAPGVAESGAREGADWSRPSAPRPLDVGRRILGQHRNTYIVVEDEQGLVLVDQHCAHERVLFERVMRSLGRDVARQALLEPAIVEVGARLAPVLAERLDALLAMGFEVEEFGAGSFAVRAVPAVAGATDPAELLRELAAQDVPASEPLERVRRLAATVACKAAVKAGFVLGHERMRWIAEALFAAEVPTTCPHGRVALLRISDRDLDHRFGRI
jgi:DNA mismatch repair protein MutL